jgi:hypothetical protein
LEMRAQFRRLLLLLSLKLMDWTLVLLISMTVCITSLVVWGHVWIEKNKNKHPKLYKQRQLIRSFLWLIFNFGGFNQ